MELSTEGTLGCVVDLRDTELESYASLFGLSCRYKIKDGKSTTAEDKDDIARLKRLAEIAEENKDHQTALLFHAKEMRAKRWNKEFSQRLDSIVDACFDIFSEYGHSLFKPSIILLGLWLGFGLFFCLFSLLSHSLHFALENLGKSILLSTINTFSFVPGSRGVREKTITDLTGCISNDWLNLASICQGVFSVIFIFLIGLALRNRYKL